MKVDEGFCITSDRC